MIDQVVGYRLWLQPVSPIAGNAERAVEASLRVVDAMFVLFVRQGSVNLGYVHAVWLMFGMISQS